MSADTPTPERVTLTDHERLAYAHFDEDDNDLGRCYLEGDVERIIAAREQALREEIAQRLDAEASVEAVLLREDVPLDEESARLAYGAQGAYEHAARIVRGGAK